MRSVSSHFVQMVCARIEVVLLLYLAVSRVASASGSTTLIQSVRDTTERLARMTDMHFGPDFESSITVDITSADIDQEIVGFGGSFTDASASVFQKLNKDLQDRILDLYFSSDGLGFTLGRVHINSCDFSLESYSFDEVSGDFELAHFDMNVSQNQAALIPLIKSAQERIRATGRSLKLVASPWSPPAWMKTNGMMNGSGNPEDWTGLRNDSHAAWAKYFAKWIKAYKRQDIQIWAVTVQNEPEAPPMRWEQCVYSPGQEADFLGLHLGPTLRAAHPDVAIFVFEHHKNHVYEWAKVIYEHPEAKKFVNGVAVHWYSGDSFDRVAQTHQKYSQAMLLSSEHSFEKHRWHPGTRMEIGDWSFGEGYAHDIIGDLNSGSVGWIDWNLLLDMKGGPNHAKNQCDAAIHGDFDIQQIYIHPQFYFMGHFSKYILPGSKRIQASIIGSRVYSGPNRDYGTCTGEDGLQGRLLHLSDMTA